ncbi:MAG: TIGR04290 family methyltransferase [Balneolaceae bacterium]
MKKLTSVQDEVEGLAPWFHNLHLPDGIQTAPDHFLGDFPRFKWREIKDDIPEDLSGWNVLDVGCNAGFYSFKLAGRGADVTAIDLDPHYLKQARWAAGIYGLKDKIKFKELQVYDLARSADTYDLVWFMGVLYHLRYPVLGMDILARKVRKILIFQTLSMPGNGIEIVSDDLPIDDREKMLNPGWPKAAFIEKKLAGDPTNWWAFNKAGIEALLRSCGMKITKKPSAEVYIAEPDPENPSPAETWNYSEYLSAIGKNWKKEAIHKIKK